MRERAERWLKIICWVLVAVLLFQLARALARSHPFARAVIPDAPTLDAAANAPVSPAPPMPAAGKAPANGFTNLSRAANSTTNAPTTNLPGVFGPTNSATNLPANLPLANPATNSPALTNSTIPSNSPALVAANQPGALASTTPKKSKSHRPPGMGGGFPPGMGMGQPLPELPRVTRARIDQIVSSELLGPVMHPLPMALMGIAGDVAFLRSDDGQTGLVKVGDSLGSLKLLRIGINRVLVEENGQQQELTIFSGMGGDSLLTTPDKNSNETPKH